MSHLIDIKIESFGAVGRFLPASLSVSKPQACRVEEVLDEISCRYPEASKAIALCACAVGENIVHRNCLIEKNVTLVLLSPVAGG